MLRSALAAAVTAGALAPWCPSAGAKAASTSQTSQLVLEIQRQREALRAAREKRRQQEAQARKQDAIKQSKQVAADAMTKGEEAYKESRYAAAYLYYKDAAAGPDAKRAAEARKRIAEIEAMARRKLVEADVLIRRRRRTQAVEVLKQLIESFPYCEAARTARDKLLRLSNMPSVRADIRFAEGEAQEQAENYHEALKIYDEVRRQWPEELAALRARVAADRIRSDPDKMAWVREAMEAEAERECPMLLNLAKNYLMNDDTARAREKLQKVVEDFPGTTYAEDARAMLDALDSPPAPPEAEEKTE
jgi:tetratricopeptide (TPR) repeat protein